VPKNNHFLNAVKAYDKDKRLTGMGMFGDAALSVESVDNKVKAILTIFEPNDDYYDYADDERFEAHEYIMAALVSVVNNALRDCGFRRIRMLSESVDPYSMDAGLTVEYAASYEIDPIRLKIPEV